MNHRSLRLLVAQNGRDALAGAITFAFVASTGFSQGGYFPPSWGWSALGCLLFSFSLLVLGTRVSLSRRELLYGASLILLLILSGSSALWSSSVGRSLEDTERTAVYVSLVLALLVVGREKSGAAVAAGLAAAATFVSTFALATRLSPGTFGYDTAGLYRLARPVGYWNGLAVLAATGLVLCLGAAVGSHHRPIRAAAAAPLPLLCLTLYFTFSRGGWIAFGIGLAVWIALEKHRAKAIPTLAGLTFVSAVAIFLATRSTGLVEAGAPYRAAVDDGHRLALSLPLIVSAAAAVAWARPVFWRGVRPRSAMSAFRGVALLAVVELACAVLIATRAPTPLAQAATSSPSPAPATPLQPRLFSSSSNSRVAYWRVAWTEYRDHPVLGSGAGTFELFWNQKRTTPIGSRFDHSVYLQMLAELGPLGLAILAIVLFAPISVLRTARELPYVPSLFGVYAVVVVHASVDWDWQLPAVFGAGLAAGAAILTAARARPLVAGARLSAVMLVVTLALAVGVVIGWRGNEASSNATTALNRGQYRQTLRYARVAERWQPWASVPWRLAGLAELGRGRRAAAKAALAKAVEKDRSDWQTWFDLSAATTGAERTAAIRLARSLNPLEPDLKADRRR